MARWGRSGRAPNSANQASCINLAINVIIMFTITIIISITISIAIIIIMISERLFGGMNVLNVVQIVESKTRTYAAKTKRMTIFEMTFAF